MRKALIVGGASGIGLSIAVRLAAREDFSKVYVVDRAQLSGEYATGKIEGFCFDLSNEDYSFFDRFDDIDTLMITAGFGKLALFKDLSEEYIISSMNVNATAVMRLVHRFYDRIASDKDFYCGVMVSIAGFMSSPTSLNVGGNFHKDIFKAWTPENKNSDIPRFQFQDQYTASSSDRFLVDASYLNFQNAQIGYTLPERITKQMRVNRLRVYVACDNIVYWSRRQGFDPRFSFAGTTNSAVNSPVRTISGGINLTF